jgi:aryl-alcohol dehydrogenase-like predicted oxidoreductase
MTANTDADNEVRCAAAVRAALGDAYGMPPQAALRFVLGNPDFATRVIGLSTIAQLDMALDALAQGPLPPAAVSKLETLWGSGFGTD